MQSEIKTFTYPNGEIQRVHLVRPESWDQVDFLNELLGWTLPDQ